jgi:7-cyano-7-deazaguanine synthase
MKSIVLLSGGLDSATCLYVSLNKGEKPLAVSFDYSQRHSIELEKAKNIASKLDIEHIIVKIDTGIFANSSLIDTSMSLNKGFVSEDTIPNTYVPGRNILFLSYAVSIAESRDIHNIYIGVNALDYSGYPDCRPDFIMAYQKAIALGTKTGVNQKSIQIITPLLHLSKKEIVLLAHSLNVPIEETISCYDPIHGRPCGECESCMLRQKGLEEAKAIIEYSYLADRL